MPTERIDNSERRLQDDLTEVLHALDFVIAAFRVYANAGSMLAWLAGDAQLRGTIEDFRSSTRITDLELIHRSLYVQAWSSFELYIRVLIVSYLEELTKHGDTFEALTAAKIIERNLYHSGVTLQQIFENRSNLLIDFDTVARNVGTSVEGSKKVILNSSSFAMFLRSPSASGIEEALRRIGVSDFNWDAIGREQAVQGVFGTRRTRETANQVRQFLEAAEKTRNDIVHRGDGYQPVNDGDVRQLIVALTAIGSALATFLRQSLP